MRKPSLDKLTKHNMDDAPDGRWVEAIKGVANDTARQVEYIRSENHGINLLKHADVELATVEIQVPDPWVIVGKTTGAPAYQNGWTAATDSRFYKDPLGVVEVRVDVVPGGAGLPIFVLPVGYRPQGTIYKFMFDAAVGASYLSVNANGNVTPGTGTVGECSSSFRFLSLDATPIPLSCWPKFIKTKFKTVAAVIVAKVVDAETTKQLPAGVVLNPVWEMSTQNGTPQVKLLNIAGLPYNRKSTVSLLIVGG